MYYYTVPMIANGVKVVCEMDLNRHLATCIQIVHYDLHSLHDHSKQHNLTRKTNNRDYMDNNDTIII